MSTYVHTSRLVLLLFCILFLIINFAGIITGNPGSVIVPQDTSSKITVFVWGKNTICKKYSVLRSMKLTLQLVVVVLNAATKFRDNLFKFTL